MMGVACICWSMCTLLSGLIDSFPLLFIFRFLLGFFDSAFNPCAYSLISDLFHPNYRTTANAIFICGVYVGEALSSLTLHTIEAYGWRASYVGTACIGITVGIFTIIIIREPKRFVFDSK